MYIYIYILILSFHSLLLYGHSPHCLSKKAISRGSALRAFRHLPSVAPIRFDRKTPTTRVALGARRDLVSACREIELVSGRENAARARDYCPLTRAFAFLAVVPWFPPREPVLQSRVGDPLCRFSSSSAGRHVATAFRGERGPGTRRRR